MNICSPRDVRKVILRAVFDEDTPKAADVREQRNDHIHGHIYCKAREYLGVRPDLAAFNREWRISKDLCPDQAAERIEEFTTRVDDEQMLR
jgi:hypothetical protein